MLPLPLLLPSSFTIMAAVLTPANFGILHVSGALWEGEGAQVLVR